TGTPLSDRDWAVDELPAYLRMNIRVIDEHGATVAMGRDVTALQQALGGRARESLAQAPAFTSDHGSTPDRVAAGARQGERLTAFDIARVPEVMEVAHGGMRMPAFPALVDAGDAVMVRLLPTAGSARAAHATGVRRLCALTAADEIRPMLEYLPAPD